MERIWAFSFSVSPRLFRTSINCFSMKNLVVENFNGLDSNRSNYEQQSIINCSIDEYPDMIFYIKPERSGIPGIFIPPVNFDISCATSS